MPAAAAHVGPAPARPRPQVDRMEFALNKSRNDAAYLRAMKELLHGDM